MEYNIKTEIKEEIVKKLVNRIYYLERENYKTKKLRDFDMADKVRKIIEIEVDKDED